MDTFFLVLQVMAQLFSLPLVEGQEWEQCAQAQWERYCAVAWDMSAEVEMAPKLPFGGPGKKEASVIALLAVAYHESGLRQGVQDCSLCDGSTARCDYGRSVSIYQLQAHTWQGYTREQVCADNRLATYLALSWLAKFRGSSKSLFRCYAGAQPDLEHAGADGIDALFNRFTKRVGVQVTGSYAIAPKAAATRVAVEDYCPDC